MRILHVARYGSIRGGAETYVAAIAAAQRDAGHEVALAYGLDPDASRPEVAAGVQLASLVEPRAQASPEEERVFAEMLDSSRPDVVHVHAPDMGWIAPLAAVHAPTLLAVHDHTLHCPVGTKYWPHPSKVCSVRPGPWCLAYNVVAGCGSLRANLTLRPYRRWRRLRARAHGLRLQCFSDAMRDLLVGAGQPAERIAVTPYPLPPQPEPVAPKEPDERPVVFASGRLNREKGFDLLLRALPHVGSPVHLVIAGEGHRRPALERLVPRLPRGNRITFTGWLSAAEMAGWYQRATLVAVPSAWVEPFGIAGLEAMAHGKPVVAFDVGGISAWLEDGRTGVLVEPGDPAALGRAISSLVDDPARREEMGRAGSARVREEFSLVGHIERLTTLYDDVRRDRGPTA